MSASPPSSSKVTLENGHDTTASQKITDIIASRNGRPYYSLEFFPPKTQQGLANLYSRIGRMIQEVDPAWIQITWGAGGTTQRTSLDLAGRVQRGHLDPNMSLSAGRNGNKSLRRNTCLHLTCTNVERATLDQTLDVSHVLRAGEIEY